MHTSAIYSASDNHFASSDKHFPKKVYDELKKEGNELVKKAAKISTKQQLRTFQRKMEHFEQKWQKVAQAHPVIAEALREILQTLSGRFPLFSTPLQMTATDSLKTSSKMLGSTPPATEKTLNIDGITTKRITLPLNPVGGETTHTFTVPNGLPTSWSEFQSPSEAWGYAMRNAVASGDKQLFTELTESYLYLCNQGVVNFPDRGGFGLMGWLVNTDTLSFENMSNVTSASDADEDILSAMIDALSVFGNLTIEDPISVGNGVHNSISLHDLALEASISFVNYDISNTSVTYNGRSYNPVLTLDSWAHDPVFQDYFDPVMFEKVASYLEANGKNSEASKLRAAATNTFAALYDQYLEYGGITNFWGAQDQYNFSWEAVRFLMRFAEYIQAGNGSEFGNFTDYKGTQHNCMDAAKEMLAHQVDYLVSISTVQNGTYHHPSGMENGCYTGPMLLALVALNNKGILPSGWGQDMMDQMITTLTECFEHDLTVYDVSSGKGWQANGYYNIQLAILSQSIMKAHGIYPGTATPPTTPALTYEQATENLNEMKTVVKGDDPLLRYFENALNSLNGVADFHQALLSFVENMVYAQAGSSAEVAFNSGSIQAKTWVVAISGYQPTIPPRMPTSLEEASSFTAIFLSRNDLNSSETTLGQSLLNALSKMMEESTPPSVDRLSLWLESGIEGLLGPEIQTAWNNSSEMTKQWISVICHM